MKNLKLKVIIKYLKPYKKEFLYGGIALLAVNILSVLIPLEVKNIIDQLKDGFSPNFIISKSLWLMFLATCMGLIRLFSRQIVFGIGRKVEVNLRQKLFDHLITQDPDWIQKKGSGDLISRATSDVENIRRLLGFTVLSLCNIVLAYSLTIPSMLSINKTLTVSALMIFPLILVMVSLFGGRMVSQRKIQQESLSKLSDLIQEDLSGISAIKIYAQEDVEKKEFNNYNRIYRDSAIKLARTASTLFPLLQGISSISLLILLGLGTSQLENGFITIGGLVALILFVERLVFPTALLGFTLNTFQLGQVSIDRVEEIFQNTPKIVDKPKAKFIKKKVNGFIEAKDLKIRYEDSKFNSLNGLNFKIKPGELVAIVGPVGCGKTTLTKSLGRTIEVPDGQLFLDSVDIKDIKLTDLRKHISIVPQEAFLFTSTISENLKFGEPTASKLRVKKSAVNAGLIDDINSFPEGFKTIVGERGITLSGGQRQRTALGRALLVDASVVVLDDALASVDNKTAAKIIEEMRENKSKTILMISHQLSVAATCDRVLVMDKGEIVQEGIHKDLIKRKGLYKKLWEREIATNKIVS
ncbi:ABC transporter, multidrug efflux family [Prochlorococcus marinus str. MIT 9515]|uniref:ABC transporter, multidrug efflux family n=1 Tax=Prochlorococcus marinus (strain MIT 9515) TaxID=167542 RepID=A2BWT3_PROM5|nr:ABC transporter ATP-binding protein [Prochlorococcus marinus]ABM72244.1 ABC transporter, multidrug efflux family [Prochlorococcus marinus str. MIT 9515]